MTTLTGIIVSSGKGAIIHDCDVHDCPMRKLDTLQERTGNPAECTYFMARQNTKVSRQ